jgi:hypothetical protein
MTRRLRPGCDRRSTVTLPARRAGGRPALDQHGRLYVVVWEGDGAATVDVVDEDGTPLAQWHCGGTDALAIALLADATGHPPRPATAHAFAEDLLAGLPRDGFALSSPEICAWLLLRAIERAER